MLSTRPRPSENSTIITTTIGNSRNIQLPLSTTNIMITTMIVDSMTVWNSTVIV